MSNMHQEHQAIALYQDKGMSIANIMKVTGLPERKVKELTKGMTKPPKPKKARKVVTKIPTALVKAVDRVYPLVIRQQGIRDYELHDILHHEYGSTWDTTTARYVSKYDSSTKKRVKEKVRLRAEQEFMELHQTRRGEDSELADLARKKQVWAAENHLLKMAIKGFGKEPLALLLERSLTLTDFLEGTPDVPMNYSSSRGDQDDESPPYYPEPKGTNPFLDHVESQGWLKKVEDRFV